MKPKKLPKKIYDEVYSRVPRLTVEAIIKNEKGILLTKRLIPPHKGYWHLTGGTVLYGENLKKAVNRVALEETGLKVKIVKRVGVLDYGVEPSGVHTVAICYVVKQIGGKLEGSDQGEEIKFFKKLPEKIYPEQAEFLKKNNLMV